MKSKNRYRKYRFYIRHDRHSVSLLSNHTVFTTKYRMPLLTPEIAKRCEQIIRQIARDLNIRIIRMNIFMTFFPYPTPFTVAKFISQIRISIERTEDEFSF